jgi:hypothetical protein
MSKWKARCEQALRAQVVAEDTIDVCEAEHSGLAQAYRDLLSENRSIYDNWFADRKRMRRLCRKVRLLKKRLAK